MPKTLIIIIIIVAVAFLIGVGILVGTRVVGGGAANGGASLSPYSAVYLTTGDIYFGVLDWSPSPHIEDPWFLQRSTDAQGQSTVGVYPFSQAAWGPSDVIYFNAQDIVFWTRLSSTSSVAQLMANPAAAAQQSAAPAQLPQNATATSPAASTSSLK
ncbi:MAG: hypothetical protein ABR884_03460 [Minisyncoccia bacterium]